MPVLQKTESTLMITPGQYLLRLMSCDIVDGTNYRTKEPEEQLKWVWRIERVLEAEPTLQQRQHLNQESWEWTSPVMTATGKTIARVEALAQRSVGLDEPIDTDALVGGLVKATFIPYQRANGQPGTKIGFVQAYQPPAAGSQAAATAPATVASVTDTSDIAGWGDDDPRPTEAHKAAYKAAVQNAMAGEWSVDDLAKLLRDLFGKGHSRELTAGQMIAVTNVLTGARPFSYTPEGAFSLTVPHPSDADDELPI